MPRILAILAAAVAFAVAAPVVAFEALYQRQLAKIAHQPSLPRPDLPCMAAKAIWLLEEEHAGGVESLWAGNIARSFRRTDWPRGISAVTQVARLWLSREENRPRGQLSWHLEGLALGVWLSRHASAAELTQALASWSSFGQGTYGMDAAARLYFGKEVSTLSVAELAMLVGLRRSPSALDPLRHPERALARRHFVLSKMVSAHLIDLSTFLEADAAPLQTVTPAEDRCTSDDD